MLEEIEAAEVVTAPQEEGFLNEPAPTQPGRDTLPAPRPHLGLTRREMNWAAAAHVSILVTVLVGLSTGGLAALLGVLIPAGIWFAHRGKSSYVVEQARQATAYQLAGLAAVLVLVTGGTLLVAMGWAVSAVLVLVLVGLILLPIMLILTLLLAVAIVALPIAQTIYGCFAAVEAHEGRPFRYPWIADLIDRCQARM